MKKHLVLALTFLLAGCVGVPVERNFPGVPESFKQSCPELQTVRDDNTQLSELMVVVTSNYKQYHECQIKVEAWQEWYKTQKKLFEGAN
jgi:starvation-inducible outer membrane lipoprotein